jgi:hypothetical protein
MWKRDWVCVRWGVGPIGGELCGQNLGFGDSPEVDEGPEIWRGGVRGGNGNTGARWFGKTRRDAL